MLTMKRAMVVVLVWLAGCAAPEPEGVEQGALPARARGGKADGLGGFVAPVLPRAGGQGEASAWGGPVAQAWAPEAIYANAVSKALGEAFAQPDTLDAVVAVPVKMKGSELRPYGDGQSNAALSFEHWGEPRPPVVGTRVVTRQGGAEVWVRFDRALPVGSGRFEVSFEVEGEVSSAVLESSAQIDGDRLVRWSPPEGMQRLWIKPEGWADGWPLHFRFPSRGVDEMVSSVPEAARSFADGRTIPDPEDVSSQTRLDGATPFERLAQHPFGAGYNRTPFLAGDVHGDYPHRHNRPTAVGSSWAWVVDEPVAPFKQVYLCVDGRDPIAEAAAGVPSGSGWHMIGDPAETLLNSLEAGPVLAGWALTAPMKGSAIERGAAAYGLGDVATARLLRPGEAFVTSSPRSGQAQFHWFAVHQRRPVCAEIWVHPCPPDEAGRFSCGAEVAIEVEAQTDFGQNVFVVGDAPELGSWDPSSALALDPSAYPRWSGALKLEAGRSVSYKFIKIDGSGEVIWEGGPDRKLVVPEGGGSVVAAWR